jgi:class 3 adenylate cyclase
MASIFYTEPEPTAASPKYLVADPSTSETRRFVFYDRIEIGRHHAGRTSVPGLLLLDEPTISHRHCIITQTPDGRCHVRDVSRNGTRVDGRRLVPNLEFEIRVGQTLGLGIGQELLLAGEPPHATETVPEERGFTAGVAGETIATVLVGDIRNYTVMVRRARTEQLQQSVNRVFEVLSGEVARLGGTVKEYHGDALLAFWEGAADGRQAVTACRAALELGRRADEIAKDRSLWRVDDFPLMMDWALATGFVMIDTFGGKQPTGLSMIGEPVVLAFRLEKLADERTGHILACASTQASASKDFRFKDLGKMQAKGFEKADHVYALLGSLAE